MFFVFFRGSSRIPQSIARVKTGSFQRFDFLTFQRGNNLFNLSRL